MQEITNIDIVQHYRNEIDMLLEEQNGIQKDLRSLKQNNSEVWTGSASVAMENKLIELQNELDCVGQQMEEIRKVLQNLCSLLSEVGETNL